MKSTARREPSADRSAASEQIVGPDQRRDPLRLSIIGARSGMPAPHEPSSGYLVQTAQSNLLFDCGPGVAGALARFVAPEQLDAVFVTHLHLDHCYDVLPIGKSILAPYVPYPTNGVRSELVGAPDRVSLFTPPGANAVLHTLQSLFPVVSAPPLDQAFDLAFDVQEYAQFETFTIKDCEITAVPVRHAVPACGFRVRSGDGASLAYTGDTGWTDSLVDLAHGVDLLLCEATLRERDNGAHGHLSAAEAGKLAAAAGVRVLVLTHVASTDPTWLHGLRMDASAHFPGPVHIAAPGACFRVRADDENPQRKEPCP